MLDVVIESRGGVICEIYCDHPDVRPIIIDWDNIDSPECAGQVGSDWLPCAPLDALPLDTREQYVNAIATTSND